MKSFLETFFTRTQHHIFFVVRYQKGPGYHRQKRRDWRTRRLHLFSKEKEAFSVEKRSGGINLPARPSSATPLRRKCIVLHAYNGEMLRGQPSKVESDLHPLFVRSENRFYL
ncbi:hypothetical protein TNCV_3750291 [Trichonephila clavipes]|nr:hypothetical protein TNCV_3750291 [Trichonephila clavipes]